MMIFPLAPSSLMLVLYVLYNSSTLNIWRVRFGTTHALGQNSVPERKRTTPKSCELKSKRARRARHDRECSVNSTTTWFSANKCHKNVVWVESSIQNSDWHNSPAAAKFLTSRRRRRAPTSHIFPKNLRKDAWSDKKKTKFLLLFFCLRVQVYKHL